MAALDRRQNPWLPGSSSSALTTPRMPAWCPGGRTAQKALRAVRAPGPLAHTASTDAHTAPAARKAAS